MNGKWTVNGGQRSGLFKVGFSIFEKVSLQGFACAKILEQFA
jgi:hypothetical protein